MTLLKSFCLSLTIFTSSVTLADEATLAQMTNQLVREKSMQGIAIFVSENHGAKTYSYAHGMANSASGQKLTAQTPVRIASNTKTYVATTVLRLYEDGLLDIDSTIDKLIREDFNALLKSDGYRTDQITVRHLLSHTGGLFDHAATKNYMDALAATPKHVWTRAEQLEKLVEWGDPLWQTNSKFRYSDSGYLLLGHMIERITGKSLAQAVRENIGFENLGILNTWWEKQEAKPEGALPRAHQFLGPRDGYDIDASFDNYGGGGLVSTPEDMARFYEALFSGKIYKKDSTLALMTSDQGIAAPDIYRLGLFPGKAGDLAFFQHTGFWGTASYYVPETGMAISAVVINQQNYRDMMKLIERLIVTLNKG